MGKIRRIDERRDLCSRRAITVELPEFMLRAFQYRLAETNDGAPPDEQVTIEHFVEIQLAETLSIADVAFLEQQVPGIGAAVSRWLAEIE